MNERKYYLDNIRWMTVVLVIIYHIIYLFNSSGVISNINVKGIPEADAFLVFVYPWFMCLLFVVAGISSKYSLEKRSNKEYIKDRAKKILLPTIVGIFAYGWIAGMITNYYNDIFVGNGNAIPGFVKYIVYSLIGVGPLWFGHVLFIAALVLVLIRKIDRKDKIGNCAKKIKPIMLVVFTLLVWGSANILNTPLVEIYRFGIYIFMFLLGYYIFSNEELIEKLSKYSIPLIIVSILCGIAYTIKYYGKNYAEMSVLKNIFTNIYLWVMIIAILGFSKKYLNFSNKFTNYMTKNNFAFYVLHYSVVVVLGFVVVNYLNLPFILNYILILIGTIVILPLLTKVISSIPVINTVILGVKKKEN